MRSSGEVVFDPTIPLTDVQADIYKPTVGLGRTLGILGRQALITAAMPYAFGSVEGNIGVEGRQSITRSGLGDFPVKLSINLHGNPALPPAEFFKAYRRTLLVGTSLTVQIPFGQYDPAKLINLGTNRWAVKPEIGVSYPMKKFYLDFYTGVWLFTENTHFFPGESLREQDPLLSLQAHISYTFRPQLWLAFDSTWYNGGSTYLNGGPPSQRQSNSRVGATLVLPLSKHQSLKFAWSTGATGRIGSDFRTIGVAWQFLWFDRMGGHRP
jgi:hypothetical protein